MLQDSRTHGDVRRDAIVEFVAEHHREKGYGPTLREVAAAVGLRTHAAAQYQIWILVEAGVLAAEPRIPRSIRLGAEMHSREPL